MLYVYGTYDNFRNKISMRLGDVYFLAKNIRADLDIIDAMWVDTMNGWNQLKLGWAGKTQQELDVFQQGIDKVHREIFGTSKLDPDNPFMQVVDRPGLYQQVAAIASGAVQNYDWTEFGVKNMFLKVSANATGETYASFAPDGTRLPGDIAPDPVDLPPDQTDPYISETFQE